MKSPQEQLDMIMKALTEMHTQLSEEAVEGGGLTTPHAPEIATTDQNLSLPEIYQELAIPSLAKNVLFNSPLDGATGALFVPTKS